MGNNLDYTHSNPFYYYNKKRKKKNTSIVKKESFDSLDYAGTGRPSKMTDDVLTKLDEAFSFSCKDEEACIKAGVSLSTFYAYCKKYPAYRQHTKLLQKLPQIGAKKVIAEAIEQGDKSLAKWLLEKRCADEYGDAKTNLNLNFGTQEKIKINLIDDEEDVKDDSLIIDVSKEEEE